MTMIYSPAVLIYATQNPTQTRPGTRTFNHYPTRTRPEVKKCYPSGPANNIHNMTSITIAALLPPFVKNQMLLCNLMILRYNFDGNDCWSILNFLAADQCYTGSIFWILTSDNSVLYQAVFVFLFSFLSFSKCIVSFFCNLWDN